LSCCEPQTIPVKRDENAYRLKNGSGFDPRFSKTEGTEAYTGNELLVKGALEAGVSLITGYPGSPVSDVFDTLGSIAPYLIEKGILAQIANNEALSTARLNGARQAGLRALAVMKSVGMHVGADALAIGNLMETHHRQGGAVVVVGDDPWNETTQINSDSRYLSKHLHMPIVEPSTFQELKDWVNVAFDLSGASDLYITYLLTTNQADGGGTVEVRPHPPLAISRIKKTTLSSQDVKLSEVVLIPPHTSMREATLDQRKEKLMTRVRELKLNRRHGPRHRRMAVGFVTSGLSYCYLEEVLQTLGLWESTPVLKLGLTYPLDEKPVLELASHVEHLVVVEEKRGFLEGQISEMLIAFKQAGRLSRVPALWGKNFPDQEKGFPSTRGLNVSILLETLGPAFLRWKKYFPRLNVPRIENELAEIQNTKSQSYEVPTRLPTFCPGCPHRDSAVVSRNLKNNFVNFDYMKKKKEKPVDVIFHGESGCHSMLQFAPYEGLMQNYSGMGVGGGTGAGMSPFITNKQVVFLGDSTFFHSGMLAISDSIKNNQDITYIILENDTTAMTGHQPTPANEKDIMGQPTPAQDIERLLRGMLPEGMTLEKINPTNQANYQKIVESIVMKPGVKVIISEKECAITLHRRLNSEKKKTIQSKGFLPREEKINITPEVCEFCLECTRQVACPGLTMESTPYGPKIATDLSTCVDDGACARTKACPSFEKVILKRVKPIGKDEFPQFDFSNFKKPASPEFDRRWCAYTAGVGGMGAGVVNAVLVRAGMKAGYDVNFLDKKGLAIRNGGVYGHVVFSKSGPVTSPVIPYGKADLLIGLDILEAARAMDAKMNLRVAHPVRTHGVINRHKNHTVLSLMGEKDFNPDELEKVLLKKIQTGKYFSADFSELSEKYVGSKLYANMMLLGAACQKGWIPLKPELMMDAISESVKPMEVESNHRAFNLGRYLVENSEFAYKGQKKESFFDVVREKSRFLEKESWLTGKWTARAYQKLMNEVHRWIDLPKESGLLLARTVYDLIRYEDVKWARIYVGYVWHTYKKDVKKFGYKATQAVIHNLYRCMAIKDEVWVAKLLISPEKYARDRERYKIDPARGDKISYIHLNRPRFTVFGKNIEFDLNTRDWMLRLMSRAKFLRRLLPQWHQEEKKFRLWYMRLVQRFTYFESKEAYTLFVDALNEPDKARGYREVRYPQMDQAVKRANALIQMLVIQNNLPHTADLPERSLHKILT